MELIEQRTKKIMEECRKRAADAGLNIQGETLEYIITNRDMTELSSKVMIPTLYDYWVHDVDVIRDKWIYDAYPHNPYETVINTRPAISFYNDNNPDWLNVMIFYHVLAHIDFFQNNVFFRRTWDDDFCGQALADKRLLNSIREEMGAQKRWVEYVIEFARGIDNLVGYYSELEEADRAARQNVFGAFSEKSSFYFGEFLRQRYDEKTVELKFYYDEIERYNQFVKQFGEKRGEEFFFRDGVFRSKFPEFNSIFEKSKKKQKIKTKDILQYLIEYSGIINKENNNWMKDVLGIIRKTSLYFQPQFRDHIANEGWASFWHERLFLADERIKGHEVDYARVNSGVLVDPRVGLNPYSVGMHLYEFIEELARKGKISYGFQLIKDSEIRRRYDEKKGEEYAKKVLLEARKNFDDFMLINFLSDDDFQDFVNKYNLFVAGARFNPDKWIIKIYIKSRSGKTYREMLNRHLYHPPYVIIDESKAKSDGLYLNHVFEGRTLVTKYIEPVLRGLEFLWGRGNTIQLETTEFEMEKQNLDYRAWLYGRNQDTEPKFKKIRALYTISDKRFTRIVL